MEPGTDRAMTMRSIYVAVVLVAFSAVIVNHLASPSSGRAVSPEDFAGACAPCGAPCPSVGKR
jgi:hypothetical protein